MRRLQWLAAPLYPLLDLHSAVYNRFHFRGIRRDLTAFLVTRALFAGAGAVVFDGGPLFRVAQRPPFLRALARIFPEGDARPLYETRDLFFSPLSALRSRRRLHLLLGDANLCEWALWLRVAHDGARARGDRGAARTRAGPSSREPLEALREVERATPELRGAARASPTARARARSRSSAPTSSASRPCSRRGAGSSAGSARALARWRETLDAPRARSREPRRPRRLDREARGSCAARSPIPPTAQRSSGAGAS